VCAGVAENGEDSCAKTATIAAVRSALFNADAFLRRGEGTRYQNKVNRENSFRVPSAVFRKTETHPSSPSVLTIE
jgi:hypothetical protein